MPECDVIPPAFLKATGLVCGQDFKVLSADKDSIFIKLEKALAGYKSTFDLERAIFEHKIRKENSFSSPWLMFERPRHKYTTITKLSIPSGATVHFSLYYGQKQPDVLELEFLKLRASMADVEEHKALYDGLGDFLSLPGTKTASWWSCADRDEQSDAFNRDCQVLYEEGKRFFPSAFSYESKICDQGVHFFASEEEAKRY